MTKPIDMDQLIELTEALQFVEDPRVQGRVKHLLVDVLVIAICGVLCGAEGIYEIEMFGKAKEKWLRKFLDLPAGIPSHDTIARVMSLVNPDELERVFREWVADVLGGQKSLKSLSLDGKSSNGTERGFNKAHRPLHVVSAYSHDRGLTLCQAESKSSGLAEAEAAIDCLKALSLKGVTVMADAGIATKKVLAQVCLQQGRYVVPIKGNNKPSLTEIEEIFEKAAGAKASQEDAAHGRKEKRSCEVLPSKGMSQTFKDKWPNCRTVFAIRRIRDDKDKRFFLQKTGDDGKQYYEKNDGEVKRTDVTTYYVASLDLTPDQALKEVRKHWQIENGLHWILDVAFKEDDWTVKAKKLARNLSLVRRIALNLVRSSNTKGSVRSRMKKASWSTDFLEQLLFGT